VSDTRIPKLTFPDVKLGKRSTPLDLLPLLYMGGAGARAEKVAGMIASGELGNPLADRIELVKKIHEEIDTSLKRGGATSSAIVGITYLRFLFSFADSAGYSLNIDTVLSVYVHWSDHLIHRIRTVKDLEQRSAYNYGITVGTLLDNIFERGTPIITSTRLRAPNTKKRVRSVAADKQNLQDTFTFGYMLLDVMDGLSLDSVWGELPLRIQMRTGQELVEWSWMRSPVHLKTNPQTPHEHFQQKQRDKRRAQYISDHTLKTRFPLVNLRIEAELLFFISQTGMNLAQAHQIKLRHFSYASTLNGYLVRDYKHRRQGEVLFEIYAEYKTIFERYLAWRKAVFPNDSDGLMFPLIRRGGRAEDKAPIFGRIKQTCKKLGMGFVVPSRLRNTRINWLLRRSGDDDMTAEQAQHSKQTLIRVYEEPSLQRTMTEVMRFWQTADPVMAPPSPGVCTGSPMPVDIIPHGATQPDCVRPSGCIWCEHHRDIDSHDYVWSISSFRYLKSLELAKYHPPQKENWPTHPALFAIERLSEKLHWFHQSNALRKGWVDESLSRIEEGEYHPSWCDLIQSVEAGL
jgi:integrase